MLAGPAAAQETATDRRIVAIPDSDFFGGDYDILRETTLDACQAACLDDGRCVAFTFNTQSGWCFLKETAGERRPAAGAVSGRIVTASDVDTAATRRAELGFLPADLLDDADRVALAIAGRVPDTDDAAELARQGRSAYDGGRFEDATESFRDALTLEPGGFHRWQDLLAAALRIETDDWQKREDLLRDNQAVAVATYLRATTEAERADALAWIGGALEDARQWKPAILSYRASLALRETPSLRATYDRLVADFGFKLVDHRIDADVAAPRICLIYSDDLGVAGEAAGDYVRVTGEAAGDYVRVTGGARLAIAASGREICIDGVRHGGRYTVIARAGLPAFDGEVTPTTIELDLYVRDRSPSVRFPGNAYLLPGHEGATIPVATVNATSLTARLYRVGDRAMARVIGDGAFLGQLSADGGDRLAQTSGELVWEGTIEVESEANAETIGAIPVRDLTGPIEPGAYVLTATTDLVQDRPWEAQATQWFIASDLGLSTHAGRDSVHVTVRSLADATPVPGAALRLVARNNRVLAEATADDSGRAVFDPGLLAGRDSLAPALLVAETDGGDGDYAILDLTRAEIDLSDRGVAGRPPPQPLDVFLTTERGVYRPGETVHLTALVRDHAANAAADLPLTMVVRRPDGKAEEPRRLGTQSLGGVVETLAMAGDAMRGTWRAAIHVDPDDDALADVAWLVEDFLPERLDVSLTHAGTPVAPGGTADVTVAVRHLYGAPGAGLEVTGSIDLRPERALETHPGFLFGLADEEARPDRTFLSTVVTDAGGEAVLRAPVPSLGSRTGLAKAILTAVATDSGGRPVERSLTLAVDDPRPRLGIRPLFEGTAPENSTVAFDVAAVVPDGATPIGEATWNLAAVHRDFQWFRRNGRWDYRAIHRTERIASGTVDLAAGAPARLDADVEWGTYELTVSAGHAVLPASVRFEAGWRSDGATLETPEALSVTLDRPSYRIGATARVRINAPFAGVADIMVADDRIIDRFSVEVADDGATVDLPVTEAWGAGAYVLVTAFRPMNLAAGRMPARAMGVAWAGVDPGDRRLEVAIDVEDTLRPRSSVPVTLRLANLSPGEPAFVTLAAVDVGILNLTGFDTPDPDGWYFGQRRLGLGIRDVYNYLIDRTVGTAVRVRTGGDASPMRLDGPPPPETLMAFHAGLVAVDDRGTATIDVPLADFNGTVRFMAMAWSATGVGHAAREAVVRDPVVVAASLPRFLAPGDTSRIALDIANVEDLAGEAYLSVVADPGLVDVPPGRADTALDLTGLDRTTFAVPITALRPGKAEIRVRLDLPDGTVLDKPLALDIRDNAPPSLVASTFDLAPGATLTLDDELTASFRPGTWRATLTASAAARLDLAGMLRTLDRYPYGCSEQITSRALPLLYLADVASAAGIAGDDAVRERIDEAIRRLVARQDATGSFGLWGIGGGDLWLDAYVTDFLVRAAETGRDVPPTALRLALDNLRNRIAYSPDFSQGGVEVAYGLFVLARSGEAALGDLRYFANARMDDFLTPLAKAQLGAALKLYGEQETAERVFRDAIADLADGETGGYRFDYGSGLRDGAAILTLASEVGVAASRTDALIRHVADGWASGRRLSTQDQAWSLMAANALISGAARPRFRLDGEPREGALFRRMGESDLAAGLTLTNDGDRPLHVVLTGTGVSLEPEPAGGPLGTLTRTYLDIKTGQPVDIATVEQGRRLVVVLSVLFAGTEGGRFIVDDPLPAGFEIDNPNLLRSGEVSALNLDLSEPVRTAEFRDDRFIAAFDRRDDGLARRDFAYIVRAVSPGVFAHPAAIVEDMYRPQNRSRTGAGMVRIDAAP